MTLQNLKEHKDLLIGAVAVLILAAGIFAFSSGGFGSRTEELDFEQLPSCGDKKEFFTESPIKTEDLRFIRPLGFVGSAPEHIYPTDHIYWFMQSTDDDVPIEVPFYSPGDMWITQITRIDMDNPTPNSTDYALRFAPCNEFRGFFIHLSTISDKLKKQMEPPFVFCGDEELGRFKTNMCVKNINIKVDAGEQLGTIGQLDWQHSVDFATYDFRVPALDYASPARWDDWQQQLVCPLDYFESELGDELKVFLGDRGNQRTKGDICGKVQQDKKGTAQGTWFTEDLRNSGDPFVRPELSLIHDYVDPDLGVIAIGFMPEESGLSSAVYHFKQSDSGFVNRDFGDIADDGKVYCYEKMYDQWDRYERPQPISILVQLTSPTTVKIGRNLETECGNGPWGFEQFAELQR